MTRPILAHALLELLAAVGALAAAAACAVRYREEAPSGAYLVAGVACTMSALLTTGHAFGSLLAERMLSTWVPLTWTVERATTVALWAGATHAVASAWSRRQAAGLLVVVVPLACLGMAVAGEESVHRLIRPTGWLVRPGDALLAVAGLTLAAWWLVTPTLVPGRWGAVPLGLYVLAEGITALWGVPLSQGFFVAHGVKVAEWAAWAWLLRPTVPVRPNAALLAVQTGALERELAHLRRWASSHRSGGDAPPPPEEPAAGAT